MLAFVRSLLVFLLGAVVGAVALLIFLPTFSVTFSNHPENRAVAKPAPVKPAPAKVAEKPAEPAKPFEPVAKADEKPTEPVAKTDEKPAEPAKPEEPVAVKPPMKETPAEPAKPEEPVAVKPAKTAEEKIDFTLLNGRPIFWPAAVAVTTATSTPLMEKGAKVADIPLDVGTTLQISKVLGDGALLVRAQGMQFEIDHRLTDFDAVVRKKIQDVVDAGSKVPPPFKSAPVYVPPPLPMPVVPPPPVKPAPVAPPATGPSSTSPATKPSPTRPSGGSLDDKMNSLFGRRMSDEEKADAKAAEKKKAPAK
ncbi:MAG: hypothetical protein ACKO3A_01240 [Opitutia bacterium]